MDLTSLIVGFALGIVGNLLTPSVRSLLITIVQRTGSGINHLSEKGVRNRLAQLEGEHAAVSNLRNQPVQAAQQVMSSFMSLLMVTWVIIALVFVASNYVSDRNVTNAIYGAIGGITGLGIRYLLQAIAVWTFINKASDFERFEQKNLATRKHIERLLGRMKQSQESAI